MGRKNGKALDIETPVPTPAGWARMGDLGLGDKVFGADGSVRDIVATSEVFPGHPCYEVSFSNGESVVADAGHQWRTSARTNGIRTTEELFHGLERGSRGDADCPLELPVSRLPRRLSDCRIQPRGGSVQIVDIRPVPPVPVKCIQVDAPDGMFLFGRTMLPTHNSTLSAPIGLYMMGADGEQGAECYSAATKEDQARIAVWTPAKLMIERSPEIARMFGISTSAHSIYNLATASSFRTLSSERHSLDALNVHCGIIDELHAHRNRDVYDLLQSARGSRLQPLIWLITTTGSDRSGICYEQRQYVARILDGAVRDETYFGVIHTLDGH